MEAKFSIVSFARPGGPVVPIGILLFDITGQELRVRFRRDFSAEDPNDAEVLSGMSDSLVTWAREIGAAKLLDYLYDISSNSIQISEPKRIVSLDLDATLEALYLAHVGNKYPSDEPQG